MKEQRSGSNPSPTTAKPDFTPPGQAAAEVVTAASWVADAAKELASHFSFGHGRDSYVTDEQRAVVAKGYAAIIEAHRPAATAAEAVQAERDRLRAALARLVGVDGREELEALEVAMRSIPAASEDKAASLDAIHALLATLDVPPEG